MSGATRRAHTERKTQDTDAKRKTQTQVIYELTLTLSGIKIVNLQIHIQVFHAVLF